jgi:SAM-dependent methyltransferase
LALINWGELWKDKLQTTQRNELSTTGYWDKRATSFNENMTNMQELTKTQLNVLQIKPEYTVLDVGAGTGRLTIPIAKLAKNVTAVEPSKNMFCLLESNIKKENLQNITSVNCSCEEFIADSNVKPHDVVVASFSLFMVDIANALKKLDELATRNVYLFLSASTWMSKTLQRIVRGNVDGVNSGDYIYVYNILHDLGILANVEIWDFESNESYNSVDDAVTKFLEIYHTPQNKEPELREHLNQLLVKENGKLWLRTKRKAVMIWWPKN